MTEENGINKVIEKLDSQHLAALVKTESVALRNMTESPTEANIRAYKKAKEERQAAQDGESDAKQNANFKDAKAALAYIQEQGRKLGQTKMYEDIKAGLLRKQPDGSFRLRDVTRYLQSLPLSGTPDKVADKAADRQRKKEVAEIRRINAVADREEFSLAVAKGKYIPKEQVYLELAARAVTLAASLKTAFEAKATDMVYMVGGDPKKVAMLVEHLEKTLDEALNEYSREMTIEVTFEMEQE